MLIILFVSGFLTSIAWTDRRDDYGEPKVNGGPVGDGWPVGDGRSRLRPGIKVLHQSFLSKYIGKIQRPAWKYL